MMRSSPYNVNCSNGLNASFLHVISLTLTVTPRLPPNVELTATHCNTLQHTATHCNTLQHTHSKRGDNPAFLHGTLQHTAIHCNTLQHTATHCNTTYILGVVTVVAPAVSQLSFLRTFRVLRPLRTMTRIQGMKPLIRCVCVCVM